MGRGVEVVSVDINGKILRNLRKHESFFNIIVADALHLPFRRNVFDLIIAIEVIEHLKSPKEFINYSHSILKSQGLPAISTPNAVIERTLGKIIFPLYLLKLQLLKRSIV